MYGAIIGDIIGAPYEFDRGPWTKDFELFTYRSHFTDDTVLTLAVLEALLCVENVEDQDALKSALTKTCRKWGQKYPDSGFGTSFYGWVFGAIDRPYGSFGNGSAMRCSAAGWLYDDLQTTKYVARMTASITHNHPEGLKGAECTAAVIYLARTGKSKEEIKEYIKQNYDYDISKSVQWLSEHHAHVESCQDSLPKALVAFFEGKDFEDTIRNTVAIGGDVDTIAAIAGSMAEAYYGIPKEIKEEAYNRLDEYIKNFINAHIEYFS